MLITNYLLSLLGALVTGALFSYVGGIFLLLAFASPYWIESFDSTFSSFRNMGLWEYCFKDFMYPYYQFPRTFNGCHNIFSHVCDINECLNSVNIQFSIIHTRNTM